MNQEIADSSKMSDFHAITIAVTYQQLQSHGINND